MHDDGRWLASLALLLLLSGVSAAAAQAAPPATQSRAVLVELFTSEGCSSCPSADDLLRKVNGTKTASGQLIVGISEHVTYWNHLGWSDPFSADAYTARQTVYRDRFHLDSVYTPQIVVNGSEQIVGSDRSGLERALQHQNSRPQSPLRITHTSVAGHVLNVSFFAGAPSRKGIDIMAVLADDLDRSNVQRGENSGRTLTHVAVARSVVRLTDLQTTTERSVQLSLPTSFDASKGHHLILFAQTAGQGAVLAIDSQPI